MQPAPFVKHPAKAAEQVESVVRVVAKAVQTWLEQAPDAHVHALR